MARTIAQIQQQIIDTKEATPELVNLNSTSKRAIWNLWTNIIATAIAYLEQLMDALKAAIDLAISKGAPATPAWIQDKVFKFQYDSSNPQIIQLVNTVPQYITVNPALCIITRCSVTTDLNNVVQVKVAKAEPPEALDSLQLASLQGYLNTIGAAGITYLAVSENPDKLYVQADVYFNGGYGAVIQTTVIAAINNYLAIFSLNQFNGSLLISDLEAAIKAVPGVSDVVLSNVRARKDADVFADGTDLVLAQQVISRLWPTVAGYIVEEDTSGKTFADSLNFIVV